MIENREKPSVEAIEQNIFKLSEDPLEFIESHSHAFIDFFDKICAYIGKIEKNTSDIIDENLEETDEVEKNIKNAFLLHTFTFGELRVAINSIDLDNPEKDLIYLVILKIGKYLSMFHALHTNLNSTKEDIPYIEIKLENFMELKSYLNQDVIYIDNANELINTIQNLSALTILLRPETVSLINKLEVLDGASVKELEKGSFYLTLSLEDLPKNFYSSLPQSEKLLLDLYTTNIINLEKEMNEKSIAIQKISQRKDLTNKAFAEGNEILFKLVPYLHEYLAVDQIADLEIARRKKQITGTADLNIKQKLAKKLTRDKKNIYTTATAKWRKESPWIQSVIQINTLDDAEEDDTIKTLEVIDNAEVLDLKQEYPIINAKREMIELKRRLKIAIIPYIYGAYGSKDSMDYLELGTLGVNNINFIISVIELIKQTANTQNLHTVIGHAITTGKLAYSKEFQQSQIMVLGKKILNQTIKINLKGGDRMIVYIENEGPKIIFLTAQEYHNRRGL
jgi:hypothetical protein